MRKASATRGTSSIGIRFVMPKAGANAGDYPSRRSSERDEDEDSERPAPPPPGMGKLVDKTV